MCAEKLAKIILIAINISFFVGGAVVLAVGVIAYVREDLLLELTDFITGTVAETFSQLEVLTSIDINGLLKDNAIIIIVVGALLFGIGFLGCCGAMKKNAMCLNIYGIIVLVILVGQVGVAVYAYMASDNLEGQIQRGLQIALNERYTNGMRFNVNSDILTLSNLDVEISWDSLQLEVQCCGVLSHMEWQEDGSAILWNKTYLYQGNVFSAVLPPSCCMRTEAGLEKQITSLETSDFVNLILCMKSELKDTYYTVGCYDRLKDIFLDNQKIIIGVFLAIILVEVLGIICACWLKSKANKD